MARFHFPLPLYAMDKKIIIITPVSRIRNLKSIKKSINFNFIFKWIIVYDGKDIENNFKYFNKFEQIEEFTYFSKNYEVQGNGQRNFALDYIDKQYSKENVFIYFLDDDNIVHKNFYKLIDQFQYNCMYTFDQQRTRYILSGTKPKLYYIDLAMFLSDFNIIKDIRFLNKTYNADGSYIQSCYKKNVEKHFYINEVASYYNYLKRNIIRRIYNRIFWFLKISFLKLIGKEVQRQFKP